VSDPLPLEPNAIVRRNVVNAIARVGPLEGIRIIDSDTHICETYDLWTSRAPTSFKARVPQVKEVDGELCWVIDGNHRMGPAWPVSCIRKNGEKTVGFELVNMKFEEAYEGAWDVDARLRYMDEAGISAQIVYPNLLGFGNQKSMGVDPELRLVTTKIFNDAMIEKQQKSGNRLLPMALLPWWDVKEAVAEIERCHKAGVRGVNIAPKPENVGLPNLGDPHWYPMWEACTHYDMPVNFHIGAGFESSAWFGTGCWNLADDRVKLAYGSSQMFFVNYEILVNIFLSRLLERFPTLRVVSVESGVGWIPFLIEALQHFMSAEQVPHSTPIKEIFQRQIFGCAWFEKDHLAYMARAAGVDNVLIMTDFPHPVCNYPDPMAFMNEAAEPFTREEREKIFGGNATKLYNIPVETF
jgi:predicted TIM-barrel fold metal-dependent hydrolase